VWDLIGLILHEKSIAILTKGQKFRTFNAYSTLHYKLYSEDGGQNFLFDENDTYLSILESGIGSPSDTSSLRSRCFCRGDNKKQKQIDPILF
jgi:hypothetical protein